MVALKTECLSTGNSETHLDKKTIKIMTYNVCFREDLELCRRMDALGDLIKHHSPDLICFQVQNLNYALFYFPILSGPHIPNCRRLHQTFICFYKNLTGGKNTKARCRIRWLSRDHIIACRYNSSPNLHMWHESKHLGRLFLLTLFKETSIQVLICTFHYK